jgi:hypothetical protein
VEYGFQTMVACTLENPKLKAMVDGLSELCWKEVLGQFSKLTELHADRMAVFCP